MTGSLTPSLSTRSRMVSMAWVTVLSFNAVSTEGFMVMVTELSAELPLRSYSVPNVLLNVSRTFAGLTRVDAGDLDDLRIVRVWLHRRARKLGRLQILLDASNGVIRLRIHRIVHYDLED